MTQKTKNKVIEKSTNIVEVESSRYNQALIDALSEGTGPKFFYKMDEDILSEIEGYDGGYEPDWQNGLPEFILSDKPLTDADKKTLVNKYWKPEEDEA